MRTKFLGLSVLYVFLVFFFPFFVFAEMSNEKTVTVIVVKQDNLVNLCETWLENPQAWNAVAEFNRLKNPHLIYPGQCLRIPANLLKGVPMDGTVTFLKGRVTSALPGALDRVSLKKGDVINQGSEIETGNDSAVEITFEDGSSFFLRPNTRVGIRTARQREPYYMIRKLFVPAGRTLMKIKKGTGQDSRFEIYTPSSISAARGTRFRVSVDSENVSRTEVLDGVVGVTGRGKEVVLDPGEGTWVKRGRIPVAPEILLLPPAMKKLAPLYQSLPVQFGLDPVEKAVSCRVILAKDPEMKDVVKEDVVKRGDPVPQAMLSDNRYYCQVLSINAAGLEGIPSQAVPFEVRINPLPPFIQRPLDGSAIKANSVELEWLNVGDAASYQVQVSRQPDFKDFYKRVDGIKSNGQSIDLDGYGDYYFRVRSIAGDGFEGLWSDGVRFSFVAPPKSPSAEVPTMNEDSISLRWQDLGPGMGYQFQMAKDTLFTKILIDKNTKQASITFDKPEDGGIYHVRIKAIDSEGYEGEFSPAQTFEIEKFPYIEAGVIATWLLGALLIIL